MTPPDNTLAARLAELHVNDPVGLFFLQALTNAYRSGQLITMVDHERAVQAAVAKAVEASDKALQDAMAYIDKGHHGMARNILAAAIRSRGVAG